MYWTDSYRKPEPTPAYFTRMTPDDRLHVIERDTGAILLDLPRTYPNLDLCSEKVREMLATVREVN